MKKLTSIILLISLCMMFGGCPYESKVPIDAPSIPINIKLLGIWNNSSSTEDVYTVVKKDEYTYNITVSTKESEDTENYDAYSSMIGGVNFINVRKINAGDNSVVYDFYKMEIKSDNKIVLTEVTENIDEVFKTSETLKSFFKQHMKNSYFFGKEELTLTRALK